MNEKQLQVFSELAQQRSFSRTAHKLNVSQSTITKQLQTLERELGCTLIHRQSAALTEEGKMVLERSVPLLAEWDQLRSICRTRGSKYTETIRIGAGTTPGTYFLPSLIKDCHDRYPHWRLHLHIDGSTAVLSLLLHHEIDAAIVGSRPEQSNLVSTEFRQDRLAVIAPPGDTEEAIDCFSELKTRVFVKRKQQSGTYQAVEEGLKHWGGTLSELETAAVVPHTESLISMVEAGVGWGFVSEYALPSAKARGCVFKGFLPHKRNFYLVYDRGNENNKVIQEFRKTAEFWQSW